MPLGTQGPITLLGGYCAEALGQNGDWSYEPELRLRGTMSVVDFETDLEREKSLSRKASTQVREWIANHLSSIPKLVCMRAYKHWNPYTGKSLIWKLLLVVGLLLLFPKDKRNVLLLAGLLAISTLITCSLYSVGGRFLVPLYGIQFSVAGIGVGMVIECLMSFFNKRMGRNEAVS